MTFDEVVEIIWGNTLGIDASDEPGKKDFIIKDDMVATGREALTFLIRELKDTYAPTIEMTQAQYDIFNSALAASKENKNDFIYFIDNLDTQSHFYSDIFGKELSAFINDSRYLMQAWLHPETIKVVDNDI